MNREELIYLTPYLLSLALSLGILAYTWRHRSVPGARVYSWFVAGQSLTILGFILELISPSLETKLLWDKFQWLTDTFLVIIPFLVFSVQFSEIKLRHPHITWGFWLGIPILFTSLLLTDGLHHLIYANPHLTPEYPFPELQYDFTIVVYSYALIYIYGANFYGISLLIRRALQPYNLHRRQYWTIAIGFLLPITLSILTLLNIDLTPQRDISPLSFAIGNLVVAWGLFRYGLFELVPIARERVLENMSDAVIVLDASNRIVDFNQAMLANISKQSAEVMGHPVQEVFAEWPNLVEQILKSEDAKIEISAKVQGELRTYDLSIFSIRDRRNRLIGRSFVAHDITRQKMLEDRYRRLSEELEQRVRERTESLRESETRLQAAIDAANIGFWDWDLASGKVVSLGHHDKLFGFAAGEFDGTYVGFEKRVHPEDREELNRVVRRAREEGSEYSHEYRIIWPDSTIHWIAGRGRFVYNETGQPVGMRGAVLDITERKQAEEQVSLLQTILMEASIAGDLASTLQVVLRHVCEKTGWVYGQAWLPRPDGSVLDCGPAWFSDSALEKFMKISQGIAFPLGKGLPGRVWLSKQPAWLENATLDPNFPRAEFAKQLGLKAALALPILAEGKVVGVIEFFLREQRAEDERLVNLIAAVAAQLGMVIERKRAEEALRQMHEDYVTLVNSVDGIVWEADAQTFAFHFVSRQAERLLGYPVESWLEEPTFWKDHLHPEDHGWAIDFCVNSIREKLPHDFEYRMLAADGRVIWLRDIVTVVVENDQPVRIQGIMVDITERKWAEGALRRTEELFHAIVEDQTEMIVRWKPDGTRTFVNNAYCRTFGKSYDELVGTTFWPLVAEPYRERELERIHSLTPDAPYSMAVHESLLPDGRTQWQEWSDRGLFDEQGCLIELQSVGRDITGRIRAEAEIRQHAARMEMLAEISQALAEVGLDVQAVFNTIARYTAERIGDSCGIRLLSNDERWLNLVAFHHPIPEVEALLKPTYLTSMPADQVWFHQILETGQSLVLPVITEEQIETLLPAQFQHVAQGFRLHSALIVPLRVEGRVIGTVALTRVDPQGPPYTPNDQVLLQELADRAGLTIQNARLFEQVERARERLEALSRRLLQVQEAERRALTAELHDRVGQNLTGLSINLQNMKALLSGEAVLRLAAKFDDAQTLVQDTTRQIRDIMAELHLPELEDYGLPAALEIYAERAASRGNLELFFDLPDLTPSSLPSDTRIAIFRAAQEAISNVLKHAIATRLEVSLEERDGRIRLKIEDDGQGFEPESLFYKETQTWGLNIMRERIESIGGRVQIESKPGEGTRVTFEIERPS